MKNLFIAFVALFVFGIIACRKHYAEDDSYTLRSPYHRLTNGKWVIQKVEIDGNDSTLAYFNETNFGTTIQFGTRNEDCDNIRTSSKWVIVPNNPIKGTVSLPFSYCLTGEPGVTTWNFNSDKSSIVMLDFLIYPYTTIIDTLKNPPVDTYVFNLLFHKISKLSDKELTFEVDTKNKHFRFTFAH